MSHDSNDVHRDERQQDERRFFLLAKEQTDGLSPDENDELEKLGRPEAPSLGDALRLLDETDQLAPDVLPNVQESIFRRSRGRFYRDRFSRARGTQALRWTLPVLVAAIAVLLTLVATVWLLFFHTGFGTP